MRCVVSLLFMLLVGAHASGAETDSLLVSNPRSFGALTVFLISSQDEVRRPYLTLEQALRTGRVIIHENNSQTLWIENRSDSDLYIQSSDILKGGQQDRMIASDLILPAHDTSHDLHVYCIEHGRSTKRGTEPIETFSASNEMAPLRHMRVVARHDLTSMVLTPHVGGLTAPDPEQLKLLESLGGLSDFNMVDDAAQESIWNDVAGAESSLTKAIGDSVTRNQSPSSLELALENRSLAAKRELYERRLGTIAEDNPHAVGIVYVIDGRIAGGDVYGSHILFCDMWPKLLRAMSTEAITAVPSREIPAPLTTDDILNFLTDATHGKSAKKPVNARTICEIIESEHSYLFLTRDAADPTAVLHRGYIGR